LPVPRDPGIKGEGLKRKGPGKKSEGGPRENEKKNGTILKLTGAAGGEKLGSARQ